MLIFHIISKEWLERHLRQYSRAITIIGVEKPIPLDICFKKNNLYISTDSCNATSRYMNAECFLIKIQPLLLLPILPSHSKQLHNI